MEPIDPANEYRKRLGEWEGQLRRAHRESIRFGNYRLGVAAVAVLMVWLSLGPHVITPWLLLIPLAVFIGLVIEHERVAGREEFARRGIRYYQRALRRMGDDWPGTGSAGALFADPNHVYSGDLDLFGKGSLFELISTARTVAGERHLADWLLNPASPEAVRERQRAVAEMRDAVQLREDLALLGEDIRAGVHAELISAWGLAPPVPFFAGARWVALAVACASIVAFVGFMAHWFGSRPLVAAIAAALSVGFAVRKHTAQVSAGADTPAHDLHILALLLARLEHVRFDSPLLERLRAAFDTGGVPASKRIHRLERWMELLDSADHLLVRIIGPPLVWRHQVAMAIEAWRRESGRDIGRWIAAIAELEAISSLASFSFEHPGACFPEIVADGHLFEARALRHPMISAARSVANDVSIGGGRKLTIVSGSNMSGKSTLLRSIGLNSVLAWAGAPVTAEAMRISPLAVGASIRIVDSLQDGKSRFYAEITRLRQIVELAGARPALFLLDELLSGTNSHDRRIGAEAVVRTLLQRGAIGLVTTHDLALTRIEEEFGGAAVNVHFEDRLEDGRVSFDYRLKPGIVTRSNALELMRIVGLEV
ncbi:MAG: DNA mismatch repair protein MutS [Verrucomicrobia bacterium]|nr:DNA mismatch repair protein MutS [Verrucomicrobiota bacterium]